MITQQILISSSLLYKYYADKAPFSMPESNYTRCTIEVHNTIEWNTCIIQCNMQYKCLPLGSPICVD